jgi:hypothetical protein
MLGKVKGNNEQKLQKKAEADERIERMITRAMPQLPNELRRLIDKIERFDERQPATLMADLERDFNTFVQQLDFQDTALWRDMIGLIVDPAFNDELKQFTNKVTSTAKQEASVDDRYSLLLRLVNEADTRVPFSPLFLLQDHADPRIMLGLQCAPSDLIAEAERETGEIRATAVVRALIEVAEPLYKMYINRIWLLSYIKEGEFPSSKKLPSFGRLVIETAGRLSDYPGLVEPDAGWMRNSACHNRRVYLPDEDAVKVWDENKPPKKIPVSDLLETVKMMYQISAVTLPRVAQVYLFRTMFSRSGIFDLLMEQVSLALSGDENEVNKAEQEITEKGRAMLAPLEAFINSHIKPVI